MSSITCTKGDRVRITTTNEWGGEGDTGTVIADARGDPCIIFDKYTGTSGNNETAQRDGYWVSANYVTKIQQLKIGDKVRITETHQWGGAGDLGTVININSLDTPLIKFHTFTGTAGDKEQGKKSGWWVQPENLELYDWSETPQFMTGDKFMMSKVSWKLDKAWKAAGCPSEVPVIMGYIAKIAVKQGSAHTDLELLPLQGYWKRENATERLKHLGLRGVDDILSKFMDVHFGVTKDKPAPIRFKDEIYVEVDPRPMHRRCDPGTRQRRGLLMAR